MVDFDHILQSKAFSIFPLFLGYVSRKWEFGDLDWPLKASSEILTKVTEKYFSWEKKDVSSALFVIREIINR